MSIDYSFGIYSVIPKTQCKDPKSGNFKNAAGIKDTAECVKVALFHNPKTVTALQACSPRVIDAFKKAGFGCGVLDNIAEAKRFPTKESETRTDILQRLNDSLNEEFTEKERLVQKLLQSPINRPTTMLDRLSGIVPSTNFIVSEFLKSAHATRKNTVSQGIAAKAPGKRWTSYFVASVLSH